MSGAKVYARSVSGPFRQSEVISDLREPQANLDSLQENGQRVVNIVGHPLVAIMTQDCDLEAIHRARERKTDLPTVLLLCDAFIATELRDLMKAHVQMSSKEWTRVKENRDERFQFLQAVDTSEDALDRGFDALALDFRRFFTMSPEFVYYQIELGTAHRRFRLESPYQEHLASRFFAFQARIALPAPHSFKKEE